MAKSPNLMTANISGYIIYILHTPLLGKMSSKKTSTYTEEASIEGTEDDAAEGTIS